MVNRLLLFECSNVRGLKSLQEYMPKHIQIMRMLHELYETGITFSCSFLENEAAMFFLLHQPHQLTVPLPDTTYPAEVQKPRCGTMIAHIGEGRRTGSLGGGRWTSSFSMTAKMIQLGSETSSLRGDKNGRESRSRLPRAILHVVMADSSAFRKMQKTRE